MNKNSSVFPLPHLSQNAPGLVQSSRLPETPRPRSRWSAQSAVLGGHVAVTTGATAPGNLEINTRAPPAPRNWGRRKSVSLVCKLRLFPRKEETKYRERLKCKKIPKVRLSEESAAGSRPPRGRGGGRPSHAGSSRAPGSGVRAGKGPRRAGSLPVAARKRRLPAHCDRRPEARSPQERESARVTARRGPRPSSRAPARPPGPQHNLTSRRTRPARAPERLGHFPRRSRARGRHLRAELGTRPRCPRPEPRAGTPPRPFLAGQNVGARQGTAARSPGLTVSAAAAARAGGSTQYGRDLRDSRGLSSRL